MRIKKDNEPKGLCKKCAYCDTCIDSKRNLNMIECSQYKQWEKKKFDKKAGMNDLKDAIRYQLDISEAKHPVELFKELLLILYVKGYQDGTYYTIKEKHYEDSKI